jgi:hypothetical protein
MPPTFRLPSPAANLRLSSHFALAGLALLAAAACSLRASTGAGEQSPPVVVPPPERATAPTSPLPAESLRRAEGVLRVAGPRVREEQSVEVDGVREIWALVWAEPPVTFCTEGWSCPCSGLEFSEQGRASLVRRRPGKPDETFSLGELALPRWERPANSGIEPPSEAELASAPPVRIMNVRDYDHDGWASEFALQVDTAPCGKRISVVVGVGRTKRAIHVFGTAEHPDEPILLTLGQWARVAAEPSTKVTTWLCGDHGAGTESEVSVRADAAGLHVREREYRCLEAGDRLVRGALLSDKPYRSRRLSDAGRMNFGARND